MKANEAPEKLYIDSREHWMKSWTAFTTKAKGDDIEYTRTDAFIEKAINFLNYKLGDVVATRVSGTIIPHHVAKQEVIDEFVKHMKGE